MTGTIRQQLTELLQNNQMNAREISQTLSITEKEAYQHLQHIGKSLQSRGQRLLIDPAFCLSCGFSFSGRKRLAKPGRCPICKNSHIQQASFTIR
jgi:predicted Zn-ribbon and HTH transcriptional regulator